MGRPACSIRVASMPFTEHSGNRWHRRDHTDLHHWDDTIGTIRLQTNARQGPIMSAMPHEIPSATSKELT
jgi:hypothetical protein